ncbi:MULTISPECIES: SDR family oxidoreductase [unclassified Crossiella]|uniref:SDR family oxidoreductase n=1 Tax=unclassified Crossiella TaxID=2620835 RepID=UPI0020004F5D|nr:MULTISPECIES: SDR family oxidoreductase [unclassified Crossiella]MCK2236318.1 SDR family oxidoreductase [Crossiella sp. S99.2]MCK2249985.1 SDR family oxidoreductase [Crossiella sp. S99.1]
MSNVLADKVVLVTGGTRGAGRGISVELGALGATVYVTGRSSRSTGPSPMGRAETIEDTAELVTAAGGTGIPVRCDHTEESDVDSLVARIRAGHGRLDVLVNDVWGGDGFSEHKPVWEHDLGKGLAMLRNGLDTHLIALHKALPLLIAQPGGLLVEITDGDEMFNQRYREAVYYDLVKAAILRLGKVMHQELAPHGGSSVALTPGFLRSEEVLDHFGVTEASWREALAKDRHFGISETPHYLGRAVAALAADPDRARWGGQSLSSWQLAKAYGFTDVDGSRPDCGSYFADNVFTESPLDRDPAQYR